MNQYYSNKRNLFWKLISEIIDCDIVSVCYESRTEILLENYIGLWDVFKQCERKGSLDSNIRNQEENDFNVLKNNLNLRLICFNGKKAGKYEEVFKNKGYKTKVLLSSSGANNGYAKERKEQWKKVMQEFL